MSSVFSKLFIITGIIPFINYLLSFDCDNHNQCYLINYQQAMLISVVCKWLSNVVYRWLSLCPPLYIPGSQAINVLHPKANVIIITLNTPLVLNPGHKNLVITCLNTQATHCCQPQHLRVMSSQPTATCNSLLSPRRGTDTLCGQIPALYGPDRLGQMTTQSLRSFDIKRLDWVCQV